MIIERNKYLNKLIAKRHNGKIKIVTGIRRCGKSFLLSTIYANWLREQGVDDAHIIRINLEDRRNKELRECGAQNEAYALGWSGFGGDWIGGQLVRGGLDGLGEIKRSV